MSIASPRAFSSWKMYSKGIGKFVKFFGLFVARSRWLHTQETATFVFVRVTMVYSDDRLIEVFHLSLSHWNVFILFQEIFFYYYFRPRSHTGKLLETGCWRRDKRTLQGVVCNCQLDEIMCRSFWWYVISLKYSKSFLSCSQRSVF